MTRAKAILATLVTILVSAVAQTAFVFAADNADIYYACATPDGRVLPRIRLNEQPKCHGRQTVVFWYAEGPSGAVELPSDCEDGDVLVVRDGQLACKGEIVAVDGNGVEIPAQVLSLSPWDIQSISPQGYWFGIERTSGRFFGPTPHSNDAIDTNHAYGQPSCQGSLYIQAGRGTAKIGYFDDYELNAGAPSEKWYIPLDAPSGEGITGASFGGVRYIWNPDIGDYGDYESAWVCDDVSIPLDSTFFQAIPDDPEVTGVPDAYPAPVDYRVP